MNPAHLTFLAWLCAVFLSVFGETTMASSLKLPEAIELTGQWQLYAQGGSDPRCALQLRVQTPALAGDLECAGSLIGSLPQTWFPTPDGLWLGDAEGTGIVHFSRQQEGHYQVRLPSGSVLIFNRLEH